jgi:hypothetical protein
VEHNENNCALRAGAETTGGVISCAHAASVNPTDTATNTEDLGEILHGLNNVFVSILLNAQFMEWKLPSYSRMRRNTHEIQRSAQRAGVLLKRLAGHSGAAKKPAGTGGDVP